MGSGGSIEEVALKSPTTSQQRKLGILIIAMVVQESKGKGEEEEEEKIKNKRSRTQIWSFKCGH